MKSDTIHELINLKARRLEVEIELGVSDFDKNHLSKEQKEHIRHDEKFHQATFKELNTLNEDIELDEQIIGHKF